LLVIWLLCEKADLNHREGVSTQPKLEQALDGVIRLPAPELKKALNRVHQVQRRAYVLLLLADGHTVRMIALC
jgi:hypothetical protein